ncbi:hypothetical protein WDZ92_36580 [Nostoc sp. NIES-2111]
MNRRLRHAGALLATAGACAPALAEDYSTTDVQLLYTTSAKADPVNGIGTRDEKATTARFEHFGTHSLGDNYLSLDLFRGHQVGGTGAGAGGGNASLQSFFVYMPRLSLTKLSGHAIQLGPLQDVGLSVRFEAGSYANYHATAPGVSLSWKVPGLAYLETALYMRKTNFSGAHPLLRVVWLAPFNVGDLKLKADGLLLVSRPDGLGTNVLAQPELRVELDRDGKVEAGLRIEYARYALGGTRYSRTTPNLMLRWNW